MTYLRILLSLFFVGLSIYTVFVIQNDGLDFVSVLVGDIAKMHWAGQFNLDFITYLILSGVWIAWRHEFSPAAVAFGAFASVAGMPVFALYLIYASVRSEGNVQEFFMGPSRAG